MKTDKPNFSRKFAARILSAFIWNREARHAFRDALTHDYVAEIRDLREQISALNARVSEMSGKFAAELAKAGSRMPPPLPPYRIEGKNNRVIIVEENGRERLLEKSERIPGLEISICGDDNEIRLHKPWNLEGTHLEIGMSPKIRNDGARIEIRERTIFRGIHLRMSFGEKQQFYFGVGSRLRGSWIMLDETSGCIIGDDCNCADDARIWGSDGHAILDKENPEKILNEVTGPITVGAHTWIGQSVRLNKNARIPANTIVASGAIVTKAFEEEYTILAGVPAKVIKRGVMREPQTLSPYLLKKNKEKSKTSE